MSATKETLDCCQHAHVGPTYQPSHVLMGGFFSSREVEDSKEVKDLLDLLDQLYVRAQIPLKGLENYDNIGLAH